jgi:hypothetical protein
MPFLRSLFPYVRQRRLHWFRLLFFAAGSTLYAQDVDVRGLVTDSASGERVPFANVRIIGTTKGASTNANGFYLIPGVPYGTYEIAGSAVGFERQVQELRVRGAEAIVVNFRLPPKPVEVSEVLIEAGRREEASRFGTSVQVLGPRDIQRVPVPVQDDVLRSLQIVPGIVSTADVSSKFYVRGGAGDQNLILLDGMKIYNPYHAFGIYSIFDPDIISSAEVFTGAFPAGYGGHLSSVLNMTTRAGNTSRFSGKADVNFLATKLQLEGPITGDNSWMVSGRKSLFDRTFRHFLRNPPPVSFYDLFFKGTLGSATGRNSLRGFFSGDDITSGNPAEPDYSWRNQAVAMSISGLGTDRIYVDAVVYANKFQVTRDAKASTIITPADSRISEDGMRAEFTFYTESRDLVYGGFELNFPEIENNFTNIQNVRQTFSSLDPEFWFWTRYQATYGRLRTDVGVHSDVVSLFDEGLSLQAVQPRVNLVYQITEGWRLLMGYGVFNQHMITINNEDDIISLFEAWIRIPASLKAEESHHYVVGLEGSIGSDLSFGLQSYYKSYPSLVLYNRDKRYPSDPDYINGDGSSSGVETLVRYGSPAVDLYLAYTLGWTSVRANGLTYSPRYDRRHTLNVMGILHALEDMDITLRYEFGSGYPFTQTVGYYDRLPLDTFDNEFTFGTSGNPFSVFGPKNESRLPNYHRLDASIVYHFQLAPLRGSVGVNLVNLLDRKNIIYYDRKTGQTVTMLEFFPSATLRVEY